MTKSTNLFNNTVKGILNEVTGKKKKRAEEDENTVGGGALGPAAGVGHSGSSDWYASGDYRTPSIFGAIQTRNGGISTKKKKKSKKKRSKKKKS